MIEKTFNALKLYREGHHTNDDIAKIFPKLFMSCLHVIHFRINHSYDTHVFFRASDQLLFENNMGNAIANHLYDNLDDILLQLFTSGVIFINGTGVKPLVFSEKDASIFQNKCNTFKGKHWNDLIGDFIDACTELFKTGTVA